MKRLYFFIFFLLPFLSFAQLQQQDSIGLMPKNDTSATSKDSTETTKDSLDLKQDSLVKTVSSRQSDFKTVMDNAFEQSRFLHSKATPAASVSKEMPPLFNDAWFYMLLALVPAKFLN